MAKSRRELADGQDGYLLSREQVNYHQLIVKKSSKLNFLIHKILKVLKKEISHKIVTKV